MFDMFNIFETFLPQLLRYPNPNDPLNGEAAAILNRSTEEYDNKVKDYVKRYATRDSLGEASKEEDEEMEEMSDIGRFVIPALDHRDHLNSHERQHKRQWLCRERSLSYSSRGY